MRKFLVIILLCSSCKSYALTWVGIDDTEVQITNYLDIDSVKKGGEFVFYTRLENVATMGLNSIVIRNKVDCKREKIIELNISYYGQPMGQGTLIEKKRMLQKRYYQNRILVDIMR